MPCSEASVSRAIRPLLIAVACLMGAEPSPAEAPPDASKPFLPAEWDRIALAERDQRLAAVVPGLTPDQVRALIHAPNHVGRQILYHRCVEQWVYDSAFPLRLEFDCPRGQDARLQSVQPVVAPGR